jgi:hypothetical protein
LPQEAAQNTAARSGTKYCRKNKRLDDEYQGDFAATNLHE